MYDMKAFYMHRISLLLDISAVRSAMHPEKGGSQISNPLSPRCPCLGAGKVSLQARYLPPSLREEDQGTERVGSVIDGVAFPRRRNVGKAMYTMPTRA